MDIYVDKYVYVNAKQFQMLYSYFLLRKIYYTTGGDV
jgi:hypothetical protein